MPVGPTLKIWIRILKRSAYLGETRRVLRWRPKIQQDRPTGQPRSRLRVRRRRGDKAIADWHRDITKGYRDFWRFGEVAFAVVVLVIGLISRLGGAIAKVGLQSATSPTFRGLFACSLGNRSQSFTVRNPAYGRDLRVLMGGSPAKFRAVGQIIVVWGTGGEK